jgi:predicted metal-dependent enzyme (double-stranded beta helix superfamily)
MSTVTLTPPAKPRSATPIPERALADIVSGLAAAPTLWRGFVPALSERSSVHLLATEAYDVWLIGWPPGNRVEPHDHGDSAGAFTVVRGALTEYRWSADGLPRPRVVDTGGVVTIDARVVHDVVADRAHEDGPAISIHAYSPPLREMGFYSDDGTRLLTRVAIESEATEPT